MVTNNLGNTSSVRHVTGSKGCFAVVEYMKDISVNPVDAQVNYFMSKMGYRKRQVVADLKDQGIILQSGAMQVMSGNVKMNTNLKGLGDFAKKFIGSKVTKESTIKPRYYGTGQVIFEPTYKYILLENLDDWGGGITIEDGLFLACDDTVNMNVTMRSTLSSAALGGEGLFNTTLSGKGIAVFESPVPEEELIIFNLDNDVVKIDGNMAIAWSPSLEFTVERTSKTLVGSAVSGEGLVNVYRGTGRVVMAPVT